jgi:uncharacterized protein with HEPN domain
MPKDNLTQANFKVSEKVYNTFKVNVMLRGENREQVITEFMENYNKKRPK